MKAQIKKGFYFLFSLVLFSLFSGCEEIEEMLDDLRVVTYTFQYNGVDMTGMSDRPSDITWIDYLDENGPVHVDLIPQNKKFIETVTFSKGGRAELSFSGAPNINSGTATLTIRCPDCENLDIVLDGKLERVYDISTFPMGSITLILE
jgi:hypothetical protein